MTALMLIQCGGSRGAVPLKPIRSEAAYGRAVAALNHLLDSGGADEKHGLAPLAALVGDLISDYERLHHPLSAVPPSLALKSLMVERGLSQSDLSEVGSQGVVSEILAGKRELNLRQVRALARRFGVSPAVFV